MRSEPCKKAGLNMRAGRYDSLAQLAKENGQTTAYVLGQAAEHYLQFVTPTESTVRPEFMSRVRASIAQNRKLLQLLADGE